MSELTTLSSPPSGKKGFKPSKTGLQSWMIAVTIFLIYVSLATFAMLATMKMESEKPGFKAIEVSKPIWFVDKTYLKKEQPPEKPSNKTP